MSSCQTRTWLGSVSGVRNRTLACAWASARLLPMPMAPSRPVARTSRRFILPSLVRPFRPDRQSLWRDLQAAAAAAIIKIVLQPCTAALTRHGPSGGEGAGWPQYGRASPLEGWRFTLEVILWSEGGGSAP